MTLNHASSAISQNYNILKNSIRQSRFWEHLKAELHWQNCSTLNQLRDTRSVKPPAYRLREIIELLTPKEVNSLTGWDFILTAVLSSSS
ncbi:hypothetical protein SD80_020900 [Scytonema tolypothrichoides VB-61278]|nr:hypothetical protein SD80_020900 [Scytonema tolypothrichoides VB-61278]